MSARARDGTGLTELARMAIPICRAAQRPVAFPRAGELVPPPSAVCLGVRRVARPACKAC